MDSYYLYIIDTETTGLDAEKNDVIEVSAIRLIYDQGKVTSEQKTWFLKATNPSTISDEALKVNQHKREDILHLTKFGKENYMLPEKAVIEMELWITDDNVSSLDRVFIGQNPEFDIRALKELWKRVGAESTFPFAVENNNRVIDTKQLVTFIDLCVGKRRQFYNLSSLVKSFGVKKERSHRAEGDTRMTADLLIKILDPLREVIVEKFKDCYDDS